MYMYIPASPLCYTVYQETFEEETFANFTDLGPFAKVFSANLEGRTHAPHPHAIDPRKFSPRNLQFHLFRKSFLPQKFPGIQYVYVYMYLSLPSPSTCCLSLARATVGKHDFVCFVGQYQLTGKVVQPFKRPIKVTVSIMPTIHYCPYNVLQSFERTLKLVFYTRNASGTIFTAEYYKAQRRVQFN